MANQQVGEELNQLSRLLFGAAATKWYGAISIELVAGLSGVVLNLMELPGDAALIAAVLVVTLIAFAYYLRVRFEEEYDTAETMRRQSVLSEGLDWPANTWQLDEWWRRAGAKLRQRVRTTPRDADYYGTTSLPGALKLAEMTIESAFYTRNLYLQLRSRIWFLFIGILILSFLTLSLALTRSNPESTDVLIAKTVYSVIPLVLSINLLGWALRLNRLIYGIEEAEKGLEHLRQTGDFTEPQVMRLVSEYNCQVASGFPIHDRLFHRWHGEIDLLWAEKKRREATNNNKIT